MSEKIRILFSIARGLAELHGAGIVHADIKSENVLFSEHYPTKIRLADFGLSILRDDDDDGVSRSTLAQTSHTRGTPIYCAPELLMNPFQDIQQGKEIKIAKSSRKTDMYAFAVLAWEILSCKRPFSDIKSEGELCATIHQGYRPPLDDLPDETPFDIVRMIQNCWNVHRSKRKIAVECVHLLQFEYLQSIKADFDIYFSHSSTPSYFLSQIFYYFIRLGYKICTDSTGDVNTSNDLLLRSKIVIVCLDSEYQSVNPYLNNLENIRKTYSKKKIFTMVIEEKLMALATQKARDVCQLNGQDSIDLGHLSRSQWDNAESALLVALINNIEPLLDKIVAVGCISSIASEQKDKLIGKLK
jgi:serine/threonine protein kinase